MNPVKINTAAIPKIEVKLLCSTFLDAIEAFYEDPKNQTAFEEWLKTQKENEHGKSNAD